MLLLPPSLLPILTLELPCILLSVPSSEEFFWGPRGAEGASWPEQILTGWADPVPMDGPCSHPPMPFHTRTSQEAGAGPHAALPSLGHWPVGRDTEPRQQHGGPGCPSGQEWGQRRETLPLSVPLCPSAPTPQPWRYSCVEHTQWGLQGLRAGSCVHPASSHCT